MLLKHYVSHFINHNDSCMQELEVKILDEKAYGKQNKSYDYIGDTSDLVFLIS